MLKKRNKYRNVVLKSDEFNFLQAQKSFSMQNYCTFNYKCMVA